MVTAFALLFLGLVVGVPRIARADIEHRVRPGQTLSRIAKRYGVSVHAIRSANRMGPKSGLRAGQFIRVPEKGVVYVRSGDTLSKIARKHKVDTSSLAKANRLRSSAKLRVGQRLLLPGYRRSGRGKKSYAKRAERPGVVSFYRIATNERMKLRMMDNQGHLRSGAVKRLARLLRSRRTGRVRSPHPRLVRLLVRVSNHFGGRTIRIVSGYRPAKGYTKHTSKHTRGRAVDFRVEGVPNAAVRDYCLGFANVGVGYYPRSVFVHLDVRDKPAAWVDVSRPGRRPRYVDPARYGIRTPGGHRVARKRSAPKSNESKASKVLRPVIELEEMNLHVVPTQKVAAVHL